MNYWAIFPKIPQFDENEFDSTIKVADENALVPQ